MAESIIRSSPAQYAAPAKWLHWLTFFLVAILIPTGIVMVDRGGRNIWDSVTDALYSTHKLIGFTLLWIVVLRLAYRFTFGRPQPERGLPSWQRSLSLANHFAMYALLLLLPLLGWLGISMFPATKLFGLVDLPSIASKSKSADQVLAIHKAVAWVLIALVSLHILAALYHYFIRKDSVLQRMLPARQKLFESGRIDSAGPVQS
jgi:cytochrome b561